MRTIQQRLNTKIVPVRPLQLAGYNNQLADKISYVAVAMVEVGGRRIRSVLIFCNTGRHDVFIGRRWLEKTGALVDCRNRKLVWRDPAPYRATSDIKIPRHEVFKLSTPNQDHQADADRRDARLDEEDYQRKWTR